MLDRFLHSLQHLVHKSYLMLFKTQKGFLKKICLCKVLDISVKK